MKNIIDFDKFLNEAYIGPDPEMYGQKSDNYQSILMTLEDLKKSSSGKAPLDDLLDLMKRALEIISTRDISNLYRRMIMAFPEVELKGSTILGLNSPNPEERRRAEKCFEIGTLVRDAIKSI
jgi:hypothetical protein